MNVQKVSHLVEITSLLSRLDDVSKQANMVSRDLDIMKRESIMLEEKTKRDTPTHPESSPFEVSNTTDSTMEDNLTKKTSLSESTLSEPAEKSSTKEIGQSELTAPLPKPSEKYNNVEIKRIELPCFSGNRKDWPEFKAMLESSN